MTAVLLDTHVWAWGLIDPDRLSRPARRAVSTASAIYISSTSFYEVAAKVRRGRWPEMDRHVARIPSALVEQGVREVPAGLDICLTAAALDWDHRDPFDRLIAATALSTRAALVSADIAFDRLWPVVPEFRRVW